MTPTTVDQTTATSRRTKRRYAHELYPHAAEGETRPLEVEVPYLYAQAVGLCVHDSGWFEAFGGGDLNLTRLAIARSQQQLEARRVALLADALLSGLAGDEAWAWADHRLDEDGECAYDRALHYGVPVRGIKPYLCGPEPEKHWHYDAPNARGERFMHQADGRESDCPDCTEPVQEQQ